MITTVRSDITWEGAPAKALEGQSEKKIRKFLKDMTGAVDVDIIDVNSWTEAEDEEDEN